MRRAQVAMEFISTYGWALLVILGTLGALSYFGVFNVNTYIPEKCEVDSAFYCEDFILNEWKPDVSVNQDDRDVSEVEFILVNALGKTIVLPDKAKIEYEGEIGTAGCGGFLNESAYDGTPDNGYPINSGEHPDPPVIGPGAKFFVVCNAGSGASIQSLPGGEKARVFFEFNYTIGADGFKHRAKGEITSFVIPS